MRIPLYMQIKFCELRSYMYYMYAAFVIRIFQCCDTCKIAL